MASVLTVGPRRCRRARLAVLLGTGALFSSSGAWARTWPVPALAPTIQAGIDSSAAGDTILVAPGTYSGPGNRDIEFRGRNVVVLGAAGAASTTIDVQADPAHPHRAFLIANQVGPTAVLDGFTIVHGYMGAAPGAPAAAAGSPGLPGTLHDLSAGGIKCQDSAPTLRNLVIRQCGSAYTGGGMSVELLADPTITNVVIQGCSAGFNGGGMSVETNSRAVITDCVLTGNHALRGGGIACSADATLRGCLVAGNNTIEWGGGVEVFYPGVATLERTIVWGNCGQDGGGEIYVDTACSLTCGCSVLNNSDIVLVGTGALTYSSGNVFTSPNFCFPLGCTAAPALDGDYQLQAGSPALAAASPCGLRIGPYDQACPAQTPVVGASWSRLKSLYK